MYTKQVPFKDYNGKPRNLPVHFNLEVREVMKLLSEFKVIFDWRESLEGPERELETEEVVRFYEAFETILLSAWGIPSDDGLNFEKVDRYQFESSKLFAAFMEMCLSDTTETDKLINAVMPPGMAEIVKKAEGNLDKLEANEETPESLRRQIEALRSKLPAEDESASA